MATKRMLAAIIFDLDGVLVNTGVYHYRAWQRIAERLGVPFGPEQMEKFLGRRRRDCLLELIGDQRLDQAEIERLLELKDEYYLQDAELMDERDLLPGVLAFIRAAQARELKLGVASSSMNARWTLEKTGLIEFMAAVGDGRTVVRSKPAPDIFIWVAGALGVRPVEAAVFEDSVAGVQAASSAGMYTVGIGPNSALGAAQWTVTGLAQVKLDDLIVRFTAAVD